ncbi:MAG: DNA polymerase III subunit delta' [Candidatus Omnitrophota bacterium]
MSLKDIKFQDRAIEFLTASMEKDRLSGSLLFFGPDSVGKSTAALMVAKALNCCMGSPSYSCDSCTSCRKIDGKNHPDVHWIVPEGAGNKIKIERIRALKENMALKPFEGKAKFFIIEDADQLSDSAANSLLKILEEPPKDSYIILISDDLYKILPTIRSRCQWVLFSQARPDDLKSFLAKERKMPEKEALLLARLSEGRIGKAIKMKEAGSIEWKNEVIDRFTEDNIIFHEDPLFFDNKREEMLGIMDVLVSWYRDIFILSNGRDRSLVVNADRIEELESRSRSLSADNVNNILREVLQARSDIAGNVNPKLVFSSLVCHLE